MFNEVYQMGGGNNDITKSFIFIVIFFIIKVALVQWSYNTIFPLLRYNFVGSYKEEYEFKKLTYFQSIIVIILFNNLFVF